MIRITPQMRVLVAVEAVDFRKGIDSLAQLCRDKLASDPFSGCVFVFRSRRATSIKVSVYDGMGFWLATKRLSQGRFRWWPEGETAREVPAHQFSAPKIRDVLPIYRSCAYVPHSKPNKEPALGCGLVHRTVSSACGPPPSPVPGTLVAPQSDETSTSHTQKGSSQ
jgi:hypothetical protein